MNDSETIDLDGFKNFLNKQNDPKCPISDAKFGAINGHLTELFGGNDYRRKFFSWAFGVDTKKARRDLSQLYKHNLWLWLDPEFEELNQTWLIREQCQRTANALIAMWQEEAGQIPIDFMSKPLTDEEQEIIDRCCEESR